MPNVKKKLSWHLADLLGRDVSACKDVVEWLKFSPSDIAQRRVNKRLMARYAAAKMILAAVEDGNSGLFTHILDRTEGKVADRLITLDANRMVEQLEAARQRVLSHDNRVTACQQVIEGEVVRDNTLDQVSSAAGGGGGCGGGYGVVGTPGEVAGSHRGVGSLMVSPSAKE